MIENFRIRNVIFNKGEYNTLETELMRLLKEKGLIF